MVRPRVLLFSWFYLPFVGGAEMFVEAITRRLRHRFDFTILTSRLQRSLARRETVEGVEVQRVGVGRAVDKFLYLPGAPLRALRGGRTDLVHAVMASGGALAAAGYLALRRRPSLLTLQDGDGEDYVRTYLGPLFRFYPHLHRPFDHVHAISSYLAERAVRYGADPREVSVIPNGCDPEWLRSAQAGADAGTLRRRLGLPGGRLIVSVSRLVAKNGIDRLVQAMPAVRTRFPDAVVVLVGDGEERARLERLAAECGVRDSLHFAGSVPPAEVGGYLRAADVFVRPSLNEGLGNAFLEAMACGLPVIGSRAGGIPDFLVDGETGLACDPDRPETIAGAIARVLGEADLAARLSRNGQALVARQYHWDSVAERVGALYDRLLDRARQDPTRS
jgi:glycosyltransferase involved in cell wall biosynthesis